MDVLAPTDPLEAPVSRGEAPRPSDPLATATGLPTKDAYWEHCEQQRIHLLGEVADDWARAQAAIHELPRIPATHIAGGVAFTDGSVVEPTNLDIAIGAGCLALFVGGQWIHWGRITPGTWADSTRGEVAGLVLLAEHCVPTMVAIDSSAAADALGAALVAQLQGRKRIPADNGDLWAQWHRAPLEIPDPGPKAWVDRPTYCTS